jgi:WhiB family redox-sensing transcriptional regulator
MSFAIGLAALVTSPSGVALAELPCRRNDPELFFAESPADVETAKALCVDCPIRTECLAGALDRREPWGVWGGELFIAGVVVARKRPRGRPRKNPVEPVAPVVADPRRSEVAA